LGLLYLLLTIFKSFYSNNMFIILQVAVLHTLDMNANGAIQGTCNMHSWSDQGFGLWNGCCYTPDHAQAQCMWDKPRQISGGVFTGNGYENAAGGGSAITASRMYTCVMSLVIMPYFSRKINNLQRAVSYR